MITSNLVVFVAEESHRYSINYKMITTDLSLQKPFLNLYSPKSSFFELLVRRSEEGNLSFEPPEEEKDVENGWARPIPSILLSFSMTEETSVVYTLFCASKESV